VGWLADAPVERALPDFQDLLAHELWHRAFHDHQAARWVTDPGAADDPAAVFLYELLDEGVGHWYSLRRWLAEKADTPEGAGRVAASFAQLAREYVPYRDEPDAEARRGRLWRSHAGVPFWEKWGAVPGALMIHRLVTARGDAAVRALLDREPYSWALAYAALAEERGWDPLPAELVEDARRLLASAP
jgi:hypothetical protein